MHLCRVSSLLSCKGSPKHCWELFKCFFLPPNIIPHHREGAIIHKYGRMCIHGSISIKWILLYGYKLPILPSLFVYKYFGSTHFFIFFGILIDCCYTCNSKASVNSRCCKNKLAIFNIIIHQYPISYNHVGHYLFDMSMPRLLSL